MRNTCDPCCFCCCLYRCCCWAQALALGPGISAEPVRGWALAASMGSRNRSRSTRRAKEKAAEPWNHVHLFVWREWLPEESDIWILRPYGCHAHRAHIQKEARAIIDYHSSMCFLDRAADSDFSNPLFESAADDLREAEALRRYMWIYNFRLRLRLRFPGQLAFVLSCSRLRGAGSSNC